MTVTDELEMLAKDCEDTALEAMKAARAESTAECAEARAWLSMAHRIRHTAKRITKEKGIALMFGATDRAR